MNCKYTFTVWAVKWMVVLRKMMKPICHTHLNSLKNDLLPHKWIHKLKNSKILS